MRRPRTIRAALSCVATAAAALGLVMTGSGAAHAATPLPAHVFAPYFEAYTRRQPRRRCPPPSGAKYLTMAFVQTAAKGSCTPYWNGDTSTPDRLRRRSAPTSPRSRRAAATSSRPSAATAPTTPAPRSPTAAPTSTRSPPRTRSVITTYNVTRIDLDTEDNSLTNTAGIDRRNKAIKQVEDWAATNGRTVQFSYTLPTTTERPGRQRPRGAAERGVQQRAHRRRQHHDVRLLRRRHPRDGDRHRDRRQRPARPARRALPDRRPPRSCGR